ncbi:MAG: DNA repair protein RadC [Pseudomonadales bacterium]|nr:DNA repair protein RadC [Pseudomonadales bacterium]MDP7359086.1 DNA repair protein RadC [Pseudomonadales bacterium]HJN52119.1 DNA repair protein RadC [Pseudomonadales bacterium]
MSMDDWPSAERPREKLLQQGAAALTDAELLAIFIRTGVKGRSAIDVARDLLRDFGGLRGLIDADAGSVCKCSGIGIAKYAQIRASLELFERYLLESLDRGDAISDPGKTRRFLKGKLRKYSREVFACMYLDNQHRLIKFEELFYGTIDGASVHAREVVKRALDHNAAAVIFAHNHPSGVAEPSQADRRITDRLKSALLLVDVRVLDHMVVGDREVISFAERGFL